MGHKKRQAVTLKCQTAGLQRPDGLKKELISLCIVDYSTGEVLINNVARPSDRNVEWRTGYSDVTATNMGDAVEKGTALNGWREARSKLWELIDSETVLVGHNLKNDLDVLRMIHTKIIDSAILTSKASAMIMGGRFQLQRLCKQLLDIDMQNRGQEGPTWLENVMVARELLIWCVKNQKVLNEWG
jgi:DNA polymerase III epsilon subunit-like protein